ACCEASRFGPGMSPIPLMPVTTARGGPFTSICSGYRFFKPSLPICRPRGPENRPGMVQLAKASLQKEQTELGGLNAVEDNARLRLAVQSAGCVTFDWNVAAGTIAWDGATDILPFRDRRRAQIFIDNIPRDKRAALETVLDTRSAESSVFLLELEVSAAMGAVAFTMSGTRIPGENGVT